MVWKKTQKGQWKKDPRLGDRVDADKWITHKASLMGGKFHLKLASCVVASTATVPPPTPESLSFSLMFDIRCFCTGDLFLSTKLIYLLINSISGTCKQDQSIFSPISWALHRTRDDLCAKVVCTCRGMPIISCLTEEILVPSRVLLQLLKECPIEHWY